LAVPGSADAVADSANMRETADKSATRRRRTAVT